MRVTGVWVKKKMGKDNKEFTFLTGKFPNFILNGAWFNLFKNTDKTDERHPDYHLVLNEDKPRQQQQQPVDAPSNSDIPF